MSRPPFSETTRRPRWLSPTLLALVFASACGDDNTSTGLPSGPDATLGADGATQDLGPSFQGDVALTVTVTPEMPSTSDPLVATVTVDGESPTNGAGIVWEWFVDGELTAVVGPEVAAELTHSGERWRVVVSVETSVGVRAGEAWVEVGNTVPSLDAVALSPVEVDRAGELQCAYSGWRDADGDESTVQITWFRADGDARYRLDGDGATRTAADLLPGDRVICRVAPLDAFDLGEPVESAPSLVVNRIPSISGVAIAPEDPTESSTLRCNVESMSDGDGDPLTLTYRWEVGGNPVPDAVFPTLSPQPRGAAVGCFVAPSDVFDDGEEVASALVTIGNLLPSVETARLEGGSVCQPWRCIAEGINDPEGDEIQLAYRWEVAGEAFDQSGDTLAAEQVTGNQSVSCFVKATDGSTLDDATPVYGPEVGSDTLSAIDQPPVVVGPAIRDHGRAGDLVTCQVQVTDDCGEAEVSYIWTIDQTTVAGATDVEFRIPEVDPRAEIQCFAVVRDATRTLPAQASNVLSLSATGWEILGDSPGALLGYDLDVIDDLDGDQFSEIVLGAPGTSIEVAEQAGAFFLVGGRDDIDQMSLSEVRGGLGGRQFEGGSGSYDIERMCCGGRFEIGRCPTQAEAGSIEAWQEGTVGAALGFSVSSVGDMDGDNLGDLVVSAPYMLISTLWRGRTFVISGEAVGNVDLLGSVATGSDGAGYVFDGECGRRLSFDQDADSILVAEDLGNGDLAGFKVAGVGDVNGDGLGDFAVGAVNSGEVDEGTIYVVYGRADGERVTGTDLYNRGCWPNEPNGEGPASGQAGFAILGYDAGVGESNWGRSLAPAGDFDGDGFDDILLHAPGLGVPHSYIVFGGPEGQSLELETAGQPEALVLWHGDFRFRDGEFTGRYAGGLAAGGGGDVNGDGYDDIAIQTIDFDIDAGLSVLYGGPDRSQELGLGNAADGSRGFVVSGYTDVESFVGDVEIVGDVNGDGYDDIAMAIPTQGRDEGRVWVVFGAPGDPEVSFRDLEAGIGGFAVFGEVPGERLGWSVAGGDIDGDGLDDVLVGVPYAEVDEIPQAGRVIIEYGRDFSGLITHYGGQGDDDIEGTTGPDSIVGGQGDDTLVGGGGEDVIYGGAGDDTIEVGDGDFRRIRGGAGDDTLRLDAAVTTFDFAELGALLEDIERIRLDGQTLSVSKVRVVGLSDTSNRLIVDGTRGLVTAAPADAWRDAGRVSTDDAEYITLVDGWAELWIDVRLQTAIPPTVFSVAMTLDENTDNETVVATVAATDPDGDDGELIWRIVERDDQGAFELRADTGEIVVATSAVLNYELDVRDLTLQVEVEDEDGLVQTASVAFELVDINEPPVLLVSAPVWGVEEGGGPEEVIGTLPAFDVDAGDELTFAISDDPDGLFAIDPATGDVSVREGSALDFETATRHQITVSVTDSDGLSVSADVTIEVRDRERIERMVTLTSSVREWSIRGDREAASFDIFELYPETAGGAPFFCVTWEAAAGSGHRESFGFNNPLASVLPVTIATDTAGTVCVEVGLAYDVGGFNADVPVEVELGFPDEISPGSTVELTTSYTIPDTGGGLWGNTPSLEVRVGLDFIDVWIIMQYCLRSIASGEGDEECHDVIDAPNPMDASISDGFVLREETWIGEPMTDGAVWWAATPASVVADTAELRIDWDEPVIDAVAALGIQTNTGQYVFESEDGTYTMTMDYIVFNQELVYVLDSRWDFDLDVEGFDVIVTLEDASVVEFPLGTTGMLDLPAAGDAIYDDGLVQMKIEVVPRANFESRLRTTQLVGFTHTVAEAVLTGFDADGEVLLVRQSGPVFRDQCTVKTLNQTGTTGRGCLSGDDDNTYTFDVTGFRPARLLGAIDVAGE